MTRTPPMASPAPPPPDAEKPRVVCRYRGMNICDARERVQIVIEGAPPRGMAGSLQVEGFRRINSHTWEAPANPMNYATAQAIGTAFFEKETP